MRIVGIVLVVLGSLALGYQSFISVSREKEKGGEAAVRKEKPVWIPPVVSGIVVVTGLILLVLANKRETT